MGRAAPTFALAGLHAESNPRNETLTLRSAFRELHGRDLLAHRDFRGLDDAAWRLVGAYHARAASGGRLDRGALSTLTDTLLDALARGPHVDGVLLCTHGAMRADGLDDADAAWISAVRAALGTGVPIIGVFDNHGTPTARSLAALDAVVAFRTIPHVDQVATMRRGLSLLAGAEGDERATHVAWRGAPLRLPSERAPSDRGPLRDAIARLDRLPTDVLSADVFIGNAWAPAGAATIGTVAMGTDRAQTEAFATATTRALWSARDRFAYPMEAGDLDATAERLQRGSDDRLVIADSGDAPGAGALGDRVDVLETVLAHATTRALLIGLVAPAWHAACEGRSVGERVALPRPGRHDAWTGTLAALPRPMGTAGLALVVSIDHVSVVVLDQRDDVPLPTAIVALGVDPEHYPVVALKTGFIPDAYLSGGATPWLALSPGVTDHRSIPGAAARR